MYELIVVGASWGGLRALERLLAMLPANLGAAIVIAQHRSPESSRGAFEQLLRAHSRYPVHEVSDKDPIEAERVYVAPPDYHLLVEGDRFALSTDERVQHARPSVDVLFETAADSHGERVIGIVLTGANADGARGLARVSRRGGVAIVQDPLTAERSEMPAAAIAATPTAAVLPVEGIAALLSELCAPRAVREAEARR